MDTYASLPFHFYAALWNKYRPALIKLMMAANDEPQQYQLYGHEFKSLNPKAKGYAFTLQAFRGKAINNIKDSAPAQDLLNVLEVSKTASELMGSNAYDFTLDKRFVLHIKKIEVPADMAHHIQ